MSQLDILLDMVEKSQEEIVHLHQELVRIPTVNTGRMPTGNETRSIPSVVMFSAKSPGFKSKPGLRILLILSIASRLT